MADLSFHANDQAALVTPVDQQDGTPRRKQTTHPLSANLALVVLGVDDKHASRANGDVIDVGLSVVRNAAVVQEAYTVVAEMFAQPLAGAALALAAGLPCRGGLRLIDHSRKNDP